MYRALHALGLAKEASFLKNNIDHYTGATFGCHENYLVRRNVPFSTVVIPALLPFLVTRQIFAVQVAWAVMMIVFIIMGKMCEMPPIQRMRFLSRFLSVPIIL